MNNDYTDLNTKLKELYDKAPLNENGHKKIYYTDLVSIWFNANNDKTTEIVNRTGLDRDGSFAWGDTPFDAPRVFDHLVICHPEFFIDYDEARACAGDFIERMEDVDIFVSGSIKGIYRLLLIKRAMDYVKTTPEGDILTCAPLDPIRDSHNDLLELALNTFKALKESHQATWRKTLAYIKSDEDTCRLFNDSMDIDFMWVYFLMFIYGGLHLEKDLSSVGLLIKRALKQSDFKTVVGGGK